MDDLPSGTVTFLFTDIEGSTRLTKRLARRYEQVLALHQRVLRDCFDEYRGREIDSQGDSFFVAFARAGDAIDCAIAAQRALQEQTWPDGVSVRVRMGLHSGEPRAAGQRYVGFGVHRAARVGAVGHGGQILISNATRELVEDELPPGTGIRELGVYELKDLERPERLFQIEAEGLQRTLPPLKARRIGGRSRLRWAVLAAAAVLLVAAVAAAFIDDGRTVGRRVGTSNNPIKITTTWKQGDPDHKAFGEVLRTFEQTTGLETDFLPFPDSEVSYLEWVRALVEDQDAPSLALLSPGMLPEFAGKGIAKPLASLGLGEDELRQSYGEAWVDLGTVDGQLYGFPIKATSKSLLWYRPDDFERLRLDVPRTWTELLSTARDLKRAGETPWALSAADSWTLTDWFENIYLRTAGPWRYDALFAGKLPFDDPSVLAALKRMTGILREDHVVGGIPGALATSFPDALEYVFGSQPRAQLYMEGGFVGPLAVQHMRPRPRPGRSIGAAPLPLSRSVPAPVVVGADYVVPFSDDESVGELLRYLSSPGAGRIGVSSGAIVSPHRLVPKRSYPNTLVLTEARQLTGAEVVRFDGSDLLPGKLDVELGSTLQAVLERPENAAALIREFQRTAAGAFNA